MNIVGNDHANVTAVERETAFDPRISVHSSGVSWGAVIGGAFVTAALSLIMLALGAGFELSAMSPWSNIGASAATFGAAAIVWLILTQAISAAMGGYLCGRLRTKWHAIHNDEVHFRDTANGFLVWAVSVVIAVGFLTSAAVTMAGGAGNSDATAAKAQDQSLSPASYFVDRLFRSDRAVAPDQATQNEARTILDHAMLRPEVPPSDATYLAQLVAARTGMSQSDAQKRVSDTLADARQTEDAARKATAHALLWIFLALLIGAFCASYAATVGGRQRDHVRVV